MENSHRSDICIVDIHGASYANHLGSKKHLENGMLIPEWLFQEPIGNEILKIYNPNPLKHKARDNIKLDDKQLNEKLAKKMINPYYFTDGVLQIRFNVTLESHHNNHANSKLKIKPNYAEFGIEVRYIKKIIIEICVSYARLKDQYEFKKQSVLSTRFDKQNEDNQVSDETELFINLNINQNSTETDLDNFDVKSPLEHQIQAREMEGSGWRFVKINSMTVNFYK